MLAKYKKLFYCCLTGFKTDVTIEMHVTFIAHMLSLVLVSLSI